MTDSDRKPSSPEARTEPRGRPNPLRSLPRLIGRSLRLVWRAQPWLFATTTTIQLLNGLFLGAQVLLVSLVLSVILGVQESSVAWDTVVLPVAGLALAVGLTTVAGVAQSQLQRL